MDSPEQPKNVISFCSGYAGIERGLELAGVAARTLAYVEIEAFAAANLVAKMESNALAPAPIWSNLKTFPAHLFRDRVDILTAGYPCQPFSAAGKRAGKNDPRHLWPYIREHIQAIRPVRCFFENVEGHISLGLREVIEDLESLGYAATWGIFSAAEVGAPHQRKRVYILAHTSSGSGRDTESIVGRQDNETKRSQDTNTITRSGENVAYPNGPLSEGRRVPSGVHQKYCEPNSICDSVRREATQQWLPEPQLGRVVDGCADRVDRLRLLGNGVVPQTAAEAWTVLKRQLNA